MSARLFFAVCVASLILVNSVVVGGSPLKPSLATSVPVKLALQSNSAPLASPSPGVWTLLGSQPPGRDGHGFVYDPKADRFIVFGGAITATGFTNSTWSYEYTNNTWTNITPRVGPSPRAGAGMAYDSAADRVILFGGVISNTGSVGDTWVFDYSNDTWTNRTPGTAPAARGLPDMVYDSSGDQTILFGGVGRLGPLGDTWSYDYPSNTWTIINANSPGAVVFASMAYDPTANRVFLFGGAVFGMTLVWKNDTWALSVADKTWTNTHASTSPSARGGAPLAYDSVSDVALLFGGANTFANTPSGYFNDTWAYNATANAWSDVTPVHSPSPRVLSALAYDPIADRAVLFGGAPGSGIPYDDAWAFQYVPPVPSLPPSAPRNLQASGGDSQVALAWEAPSSNGSSPVTNYRIYRGTVPGGESLLTTVGNVLTYTDTGVTNGVRYYYEVGAVSSAGEGPKSTETSATPRTTPSSPLGLAAVAGNTHVTLNWQAPASDGGSAITNYTVYRGTSSGGETLLTTLGTVLTYVDPGLANGQTYYYEVTATNGVGEGPKSTEASATPTAPPDATPPTITITSPTNNMEVSSTIVTVTGTAEDNVAVAKVEVSTNGVTWTTASGTTAWSADVTLHVGSNTIYVRATDTSGNQATTRITVVVTSPGSGASGLPLPLIAGFGIVVVLVAAATALLVNRRRRR